MAVRCVPSVGRLIMRIVEIASTLSIGCSVCGQRAVQVLVDEIANNDRQWVIAEIVESQCVRHAIVMTEKQHEG